MSLDQLYQNVFTVIILGSLVLWGYCKKTGKTLKELLQSLTDWAKGEEE